MISDINKQLIANPEHIKNILDTFGFCNIDIRTKEIRCGISKDNNSSSVRIRLNDKLSSDDFGRDIHGNLISFLMKSKGLEFQEVFKVIKNELGISEYTYFKQPSIFGGFYNKIKRHNTSTLDMPIYDDSILSNYIRSPNILFLRDGISLESQKKFKIGIDTITQRISCPWYDFEGNLVGVTGRYLGNYNEDEIPKWFPIIPHPKSQTLYGYIENYAYLQDCDEIYLGESEKFTMQLDTMNIHTACSLGGNTIHAPQIKHLIWLNPKKIIFCLDEGLDEEIIINQCKKVISLLKFFDIKVGYIIDRENKIMPKDSKCSPSDLGKGKFLELKNNYIEWVV
jgi:DNA primase